MKLYPPLQAVRLSSNAVDIASARASRAKRFMVVLSDVVGVVVYVFFVFHLPKHESSLLFHVGKDGVFDVEVVDVAYFVEDFVDFEFDIVVHSVGKLVIDIVILRKE